jgi:hypothetical protein
MEDFGTIHPLKVAGLTISIFATLLLAVLVQRLHTKMEHYKSISGPVIRYIKIETGLTSIIFILLIVSFILVILGEIEEKSNLNGRIDDRIRSLCGCQSLH